MFTEDLKRSLATARSEAHRLHHAGVRPEHVALGLLRSPSHTVSTLLGGHAAEGLAAELERRAGPPERELENPHDLPWEQAAKDVLERAMHEAKSLAHADLGGEHVLLGLLLGNEPLPRAVLEACGIDAETVRAGIQAARGPGAA